MSSGSTRTPTSTRSDDNLSGFTDVMGLAILTGSGWRALRETIPGFAPVPEADVLLAAVRDLEPYQRERLARFGGRVRAGGASRRTPSPRRSTRSPRAGHRTSTSTWTSTRWTPCAGRANPYAAPGGPGLGGAARRRSTRCSRASPSRAAAFTAYDPRVDADGAVAAAARRIAALIARRVAGRRATAA